MGLCNQLNNNSICKFNLILHIFKFLEFLFFIFFYLKQSEFSPIYEGPEHLHSTKKLNDMFVEKSKLVSSLSSTENTKTSKSKSKGKYKVIYTKFPYNYLGQKFDIL
jgi:hypothetical protein